MSWNEHVLNFWEHVHRRGSNVHIGNTHAKDYTSYFTQAGPFAADLKRAKAVLDIGPGFGRFIEALPAKECHAIDVSEVSRKRSESQGAIAHAPGKIGAGLVDLVTCLSVVQHCDESAFKVILSDAARALRPGGRFYLNGVHGGHHTPSPEGRLSGGRFSYSPARARELAAENGLSVVGENVYRLGALEVWVLCLGKP
jgi:2-polyprenyl-3-methyl-5-hydroxy-6-metoxy-1,4-benzoquinol methylase